MEADEQSLKILPNYLLIDSDKKYLIEDRFASSLLQFCIMFQFNVEFTILIVLKTLFFLSDYFTRFQEISIRKLLPTRYLSKGLIVCSYIINLPIMNEIFL